MPAPPSDEGSGPPPRDATHGVDAEALPDQGFACVQVGRRQSRFVAYERGEDEWIEVRRDTERPSLFRAIRHRLRRRGLAVAILGPDGAGKSTVVERITAGFHFPASSIYMGLYQQGRRRPARVPGADLMAALVKQWSRWLAGFVQRLRGRLVVFDRYTYDALLSLQPPASRRVRIRRFILARACPQPDLVVILDAPPEVLYERKPEHDLALLARHRTGLLQLHRRLGPRSVLVDATQDADVVAGEITAEIWARYARRLG